MRENALHTTDDVESRIEWFTGTKPKKHLSLRKKVNQSNYYLRKKAKEALKRKPRKIDAEAERIAEELRERGLL